VGHRNPPIIGAHATDLLDDFTKVVRTAIDFAVYRTQSPVFWATLEPPDALQVPPLPHRSLTINLHLHPTTAPDSLYALTSRIQREVALRHLAHSDHITHPPHLYLPAPQIALTSLPYEPDRHLTDIINSSTVAKHSSAST